MPMAASAMSQSTPPCSVPIGFASRSSAASSMRARPLSIAVSRAPSSTRIGGWARSPSTISFAKSSMVGIGARHGTSAARFMHRARHRIHDGRLEMATAAMERHEHSEGRVAQAIEQQTAKLPSDTFLWAAVGAISTSMTLQMLGKQHASLFVGQWAPTFLILGLYNKIVKELGHDANDSRMRSQGSRI